MRMLLVSKGKTMKKLIILCLSLLLLQSTTVFAGETAKEAVVGGKTSVASTLLAHAEIALEHAKKGAQLAKGETKFHMDEAIKSLEEAIKHGKLQHGQGG